MWGPGAALRTTDSETRLECLHSKNFTAVRQIDSPHALDSPRTHHFGSLSSCSISFNRGIGWTIEKNILNCFDKILHTGADFQ